MDIAQSPICAVEYIKKSYVYFYILKHGFNGFSTMFAEHHPLKSLMENFHCLSTASASRTILLCISFECKQGECREQRQALHAARFHLLKLLYATVVVNTSAR